MPERGAQIRPLASLALVPAGALAVHQLRYWLAFGGRAGTMLAAQGHSYLHSLVPWIVLALAFAVGAFIRALGRALGGHCSLPRYTLSFSALWLVCATSLIAIYTTQEFLEGLVLTGHPAGLVGIFGYGGWWSVPAALAVGLVLTAALIGARWVLREVAERHRPTPSRPRPAAVIARRPRYMSLARLVPLAEGWSGRGPPR